MFQFAFFMLPEPGHIFPSLRVAESLVRKGYSVFYISVPALQSYLNNRGFQVHTILESVLPMADPGDLLTATEGTIVQRQILTHLDITGRSLAELFAEELRRLRFDLLVCDSGIIHTCGDELQRILGVPIVSLSVVLPGDERTQVPSIPEIVLCPQEFDIPGRIWNPRNANCQTFYAEPSLFETRGEKTSSHENVSIDKPLLYCSFGTQTLRYPEAAQVFANIVEAVSRIAGCQSIISWSNNRSLLSSVDPSPNVQFVQNASQLEMLKMSSLFITHGGLGGLKESIMCGVPTLVVPFDMDQPNNAARVEHHRLGYRCSPSECNPAMIRDMVIALLSDKDVLCRVGHMRSVFWKYEFSAPASDFISHTATAL